MFQLKKIKDKIYLLMFDEHYELCMHFLRIQEFYESPNPQFHNNTFNIVDLMQWYAKHYGNGAFTYPDENRYDLFMRAIFQQLYNDNNGNDFYLMGANSKSKDVIKHELAHALFFTNPNYRNHMTQLVEGLPNRVRNLIFKKLSSKMYNSTVHIDETQAYLSTCLSEFLDISSIQKVRKPFIMYYNKHTRNIVL